jgi:hypothetical protein
MELQRLNPRLRVEQIQDAGHGVPYDQPEHFEAVVKSFLCSVAELSSSSSSFGPKGDRWLDPDCPPCRHHTGEQ